MPKLIIITGEENPGLRTMCKPVKKFDSSLKKFAKDLKQAMFDANGLGIAAPQVDRQIRLFWVLLDLKTDDERLVCMVNPDILERSKAQETDEEGCLSLPGIFGQVERSKKIKVEFFDLDGRKMMLELKGLNARVVLHENDHLNGVLFIDKLSEVEEKELL
ncbi:peptide deformylase [Candidatus Gracilibacteria bacterium]|nr:peptide deformylase [Candidatus Gracilibacteria bacterium]